MKNMDRKRIAAGFTCMLLALACAAAANESAPPADFNPNKAVETDSRIRENGWPHGANTLPGFKGEQGAF